MQTEECKDHRLYRATPLDRDTVKGYKYRFLFTEQNAYCLFHLCFYNQFLICVSCCLLACVFGSVLFFVFFRITDKLLPFDLLSILILDKLCMNLMSFIGIFFSFSLINCIYFSNVTPTYYMEMK